jgi:hypothetical protein
MISFLQPTDGGPVKIGVAADVDARIGRLESHYGHLLALLATVSTPSPRRASPPWLAKLSTSGASKGTAHLGMWTKRHIRPRKTVSFLSLGCSAV